MIECKQISLKDLVVGCWYVGRGRRANVGLWNGDCFSVISDCMVWTGSVKTVTESEECIKHEYYYTDDEGSFQPFLKVDEGKTVHIIEENGFGGGYGKKVRFEKSV